jgi:hypothetical protein
LSGRSQACSYAHKYAPTTAAVAAPVRL